MNRKFLITCLLVVGCNGSDKGSDREPGENGPSGRSNVTSELGDFLPAVDGSGSFSGQKNWIGKCQGDDATILKMRLSNNVWALRSEDGGNSISNNRYEAKGSTVTFFDKFMDEMECTLIKQPFSVLDKTSNAHLECTNNMSATSPFADCVILDFIPEEKTSVPGPTSSDFPKGTWQATCEKGSVLGKVDLNFGAEAVTMSAEASGTGIFLLQGQSILFTDNQSFDYTIADGKIDIFTGNTRSAPLSCSLTSSGDISCQMGIYIGILMENSSQPITPTCQNPTFKKKS
ncbi:MAG TPA: hypothetical protein VE954_26865 [Oligoflexus sp.]|uniref:hypothetical protein n=1 Tax=Oligoflexus sp. TaxID=1971216 RepID=UPI002D2DADDA|nr:hypothetical protein [Oligoflexus sp.]HYX36746.1 hypothetical protein [Oligoflexus sp.]